jgi:hypothetical protein
MRAQAHFWDACEFPGPFEQLVCREVVHRLCIEAQSTSNLLRLKQHMPRAVSENFLHRCIQKVSDSREGQHGESVRELKFVLAPAAILVW